MKYLFIVPLSLLLTACAVGPGYHRPELRVPEHWTEPLTETTVGDWQLARPQDDHPKGAWWTVFNDRELDRLELQALTGNLPLQISLSRLEQARAAAKISRAALFPGLDLGTKTSRTRTSANRPSTGNGTVTSSLQNDQALAFAVSYEADLFGRIGHDIEASDAGEQQARADLENVRLLLTADVAANYFSLRALESEIALLEQNVSAQQQAFQVIRARHQDGAANGIDLAQQEVLIDSSRSQLALLQRQGAQQRHALATLLGLTADEFNLPAQSLPETLPSIPPLLPAEILQRRPDIAAAERAVAAANAQIGVARSAWFPSLKINGSDGWESRQLATLFDTPSIAWSLGFAFSQTLFDGGRTRARVDYANAAHQQATSAYRQTVLKAWQEVEDGFAGNRLLTTAHREAQTASQAAQRVAAIVEQRYQAGLSNALDRYNARVTALTMQRQVQQLAGQKLVNTVYLIKALGGDWNSPITTMADIDGNN